MSRAQGQAPASILAALLREKRRRLGITQVELAQRLRRSQAFVSKFEAGERKLNVDEVVEACAALDLGLLPLLTEWAEALGAQT